ncbi:MAG: Uma2 family endonuclease [Chitinophagales bacterium]
MAPAKKLDLQERKYTVEEYFELEQTKEERNDFHDGYLYPPVATTKIHNEIVFNITLELKQKLKGKTCKVYAESIMTQLRQNRNYVYPDVVVTCDERDAEDPLLVKYPIVVFEVLSDSTAKYDRTKKFFQYQRIESMQQCVFIHQKQYLVETFYKNEQGQWIYEWMDKTTDSLKLYALGLEVLLSGIYEGINLKEEE